MTATSLRVALGWKGAKTTLDPFGSDSSCGFRMVLLVDEFAGGERNAS